MPNARTLAQMLCDELSSDELDLLREDPIEAIPLIIPDISVAVVDHDLDVDCSIEGLYRQASRTILVRRAGSERRTRFTAIHEFGHDQARHTAAVARHLAPLRGTTYRRTEERIADAFAAAVLIPEDAVDDVLDDRAPTAHDLVELFRRPDVGGSREACCVRIAQRMHGNGYVVLAVEAVLQFCATVGTAYPIRRGTRQDQVGLLRRARSNGDAKDPNARLQFDGDEARFTAEYAGQAVQDGDYTFAVLTDSTSPPWGGWISPRSQSGDAPEIYCGECDEISEAWQRCDTNPSHRTCSRCGWCECRQPRIATPTRACRICGSTKRVDLFPDDGPDCCDCV